MIALALQSQANAIATGLCIAVAIHRRSCITRTDSRSLMLRTIRHLLEMIRFSHTLFALPFALLGGRDGLDDAAARDETTDRRPFQLATRPGHPPLHGRRPQRRDGLQPPGRSADRRRESAHENAAPAGWHSCRRQRHRCSRWLVERLFIAGTLLFLPNWLPLALSLPVLLFLLGYSYTKRFTSLAHFWLGAALDARAGLGLDRHPRRGAAGSIRPTSCRRWCSAGRCWPGSPASTSSMPARTPISTARRGCTACRRRSASSARCGWRRSATWLTLVLLALLPLALSAGAAGLDLWPGRRGGRRAAGL